MKRVPQSLTPNPLNERAYAIDITLTEGRTCRFEYSDPELAREQYLQYTATGVVNNQIIKQITKSF